LPPSSSCSQLVGGISQGSVVCDSACKVDSSGCSPKCNPMTNEGCDSSFQTCEFYSLPSFSCWQSSDPNPPPKVGLCDACGIDYCEAGLHCVGFEGYPRKCTLFCQTDADCKQGGVCDLGQGVQGFGVCVTEKGKPEAPCGAAGAGG
jgi:hypothetical protein